MREKKTKQNWLAKRGVFVSIVVVAAVILISVVMNMVLPSKEEAGSTFDSAAWEDAVRQAEEKQAYEQKAASAAATTAPQTAAPQQGTSSAPKSTADMTAAPTLTDAPNNAAQTFEDGSTPSASAEPTSSASSASSSGERVQTGVKLALPVQGAVSKDFSADELVYSETMDDWRVHEGLDFAAPENSDVLAAADGTVEAVTRDGMLGTTVIIGHEGGVKTLYANLNDQELPAVGAQVKQGAVIGKVGNSAALEVEEPSHIHFEVIFNEKSVNPHDYLADTVTDDE